VTEYRSAPYRAALAALVWLALPYSEAIAIDAVTFTARADDGVELAVRQFPAESPSIPRPTLVFIHGWSQAQLVWDEPIARLAGDYPIVSYDLRGHGASSKPDTGSAYAERFRHARDLAAVLAATETDRFVPIGWSFGAIIASDAARYFGPRRVCGLVLVAGPAEAGTEFVRTQFGPLMSEIGPMRDGPDGSAEERTAVRRFLTGSRRIGTWSGARLAELEAANLALTPTLRRLVVTRPSYENHEALNASGIATLVIHGGADPVLGVAVAERLARRLDRVTVSVYPESGHWPFVERPERFHDDLVSFVDDACAAR